MIKLKSVLSEEICRKYRGFGVDKPVRTGMISESSGYDIVFGGIRYPENVIAYVAGPDSARIGHERNMGRNRWVYKEENGVIFWHIYPPSENDK